MHTLGLNQQIRPARLLGSAANVDTSDLNASSGNAGVLLAGDAAFLVLTGINYFGCKKFG